MKIKVYTLTHEDLTPKCIGTIKGEAGESLADLRLHFEEKQVLHFPFQFRDVEDSYRVAVALESLNDIEDSIFLIHAAEVEAELENPICKSQRLGSDVDDRLGNDMDLVGSRHSNEVQVEEPAVPEFPEIHDTLTPDMGSNYTAY